MNERIFVGYTSINILYFSCTFSSRYVSFSILSSQYVFYETFDLIETVEFYIFNYLANASSENCYFLISTTSCDPSLLQLRTLFCDVYVRWIRLLTIKVA